MILIESLLQWMGPETLTSDEHKFMMLVSHLSVYPFGRWSSSRFLLLFDSRYLHIDASLTNFVTRTPIVMDEIDGLIVHNCRIWKLSHFMHARMNRLVFGVANDFWYDESQVSGR